MQIYLDNAATTALDPEVLEAMLPYMTEHFGNPSSIHAHGNKVRSGIEQARKKIAKLLNASPSEIFFTSGGTEADNTAIRCAIRDYDLKNAITSPLEHHAVLHTLEELEKQDIIKLHLVKLDENGDISLTHLEELLQKNPSALVSLMYANNEIGNLTDIQKVGELCETYEAYFHSDFVQAVGHFSIDLQELKVHSMAVAAHKFHGPKGVGLLYMNQAKKIKPFITGGAQERNMRGGTENVYGIVGMAKAMEMAYENLENHRQHIIELKKSMIKKLQENFEDIQFNGNSADLENSLYTVLNVSFPPSPVNDMLLFSMDIHQISASGGSACSSGSAIGSHVLQALNTNPERASVRFSFSKNNTQAEIDYTIEKLQLIFSEQMGVL